MTKNNFFVALGAVGFLLAFVFAMASSHQPAFEISTDARSLSEQTSVADTKSNESVGLHEKTLHVVAESPQSTDSFELIEKKYAKFNQEEAQQEVRVIDDEARRVARKNFNEFSPEERIAFLNRQREKAVLMNKIILAKLERIKK